MSTSPVAASSFLSEEVDAPVKIRRVIKMAPCGSCHVEVNRDDMWAMNTLICSGDDKVKKRIR